MDTNTQFNIGDKVYYPKYQDLFFKGFGKVIEKYDNIIVVSFGKEGNQLYDRTLFTEEGYYNDNIKKKVLFKDEKEYLEHKDNFEFPKIVLKKSDSTDKMYETLLLLLEIKDFFNYDWQPDWEDRTEPKYYIRNYKGEIDSGSNLGYVESRLFSFYRTELCEMFIEVYRPYLEKVKWFV